MTRLLFGPIFLREMRSIGRRRSSYLWRSVLVLIIIALLALATMSQFRHIRGTGIAAIQQLQQLAPQIALIAIWTGFIFIALLSPILTAGAIADERTKGTLATLLTTPLTATQILAGKLTSRLAQIAILALLPAPILLSIRVFGGFDAQLVLAALVIILTTGTLGATLGLWYSARHRRSTNAALFAIMTLVLTMGGPFGLVGIVGSGTREYLRKHDMPNNFPYTFEDTINVMMTTCAPAALAVTSAASTRSMGGPSPTLTIAGHQVPIWALNSLYSITLAGIFFHWSRKRLRTVMAEAAGNTPSDATSPEPTPEPTPASESAPNPTTDPAATPTPPRRRKRRRNVLERPSREIDDHPILWRELRQTMRTSRTFNRVLISFVLVGLALLYWRVPLIESTLHSMLAVITLLVAVVWSIFLTTVGISTERESRTWEVLLTTPLTPRQIVLGKLLGALRGMWFIPVVLITHLVISVGAGFVAWTLPLHLLLTILPPVLLFAATGVFASLIFKRSTAAAVANLVFALTILAGPWIFLGILETTASSRSPIRDAYTVVAATNPFSAAVAATEGASDFATRTANARYGFGDGYRYGKNFSTLPFTLILATTALGYSILALIAAYASIALFDRFTGRPRISHRALKSEPVPQP